MQEEINQIEEAKRAAAELNAATDRLQKLLESENSERVKEILSGKTDAGIPQEKPVEETPKEYAARILRGGK